VRTSELDRLLAVARLGADLEAGPPEQLDQVEADDRLVFGYEDPDSPSLSAPAAAITPRSGVCGLRRRRAALR
jgi:hypothetical protein